MRPILAAVVLALLLPAAVRASTDVLIEINTGRQEGLFTKSPVYQRAILSRPDKPTDTAMLFFRGYPGIARIRSVADKNRNLIPFLRMNEQLFLDAGIALVVVDCPTDQWGADGYQPTACLDRYRSSRQHADDVRGVIAALKAEHGLSRVYIIGHSYGSISSRWLARRLGTEIAGSIHSASMNVPNKLGAGNSMSNFNYNFKAAPQVHVHHANDACFNTPYNTVKGYAGESLISVYGGAPEGDPCEGKHLHSYRGRETAVVQAIIDWIQTGKVEKRVGE